MEKMNERKKFYLKKLIFLMLFLGFWILNAIHIFQLETGRELSIALLYLLIFLPITLSILLDYEVFSLFIIILYEIAMLIMSIVMLSMGLAAKEVGTFDIFVLLIDGLFALFLIAAAIQYLRNKNHTLKIACLIVAIIHLTMVVVSFILNGEFIFDTFYDFFRNVLIILIFSIYIVTFPKMQLKIFKDEK